MKYLLWLCLLLCSCVPGYKYTLRFDNDILKPTTNHDNNYTNAVRVSAANGNKEYYVQQLIYTPDKPGKRSVTQIPGQRPYAGYLAVGYASHIQTSPSTQDTLGIEVGVIGPSAFGKQTQLGVHKALGQLYPLGWDNQLKDEPIVNVTLERRNRLVLGQYADLTGLVGANVGNLFDQGYLGGTLRVGYNLPRFNHVPIFPRLPRAVSSKRNFSAYLFAETLGRIVARNLFLDGNSFTDSASVDSELLVAEGRLGVVVEYGDYSAGYVYQKLSREYETETGSGADFGEIFLGVKW